MKIPTSINNASLQIIINEVTSIFSARLLVDLGGEVVGVVQGGWAHPAAAQVVDPTVTTMTAHLMEKKSPHRNSPTLGGLFGQKTQTKRAKEKRLGFQR